MFPETEISIASSEKIVSLREGVLRKVKKHVEPQTRMEQEAVSGNYGMNVYVIESNRALPFYAFQLPGITMEPADKDDEMHVYLIESNGAIPVYAFRPPNMTKVLEIPVFREPRTQMQQMMRDASNPEGIDYYTREAGMLMPLAQFRPHLLHDNAYAKISTEICRPVNWVYTLGVLNNTNGWDSSAQYFGYDMG
jgi:hypothetical protein